MLVLDTGVMMVIITRITEKESLITDQAGRGIRMPRMIKKSEEEDPVRKPAKDIDPVLTRTGGAYTPPAKLRMMQAQLTDKSIKV